MHFLQLAQKSKKKKREKKRNVPKDVNAHSDEEDTHSVTRTCQTKLLVLVEAQPAQKKLGFFPSQLFPTKSCATIHH